MPFFTTLIPDDKYSLCNREKLPQLIQMQLSKKLNIFSQFFAALLHSAHSVSNISQQKMSLIVSIFRKL